MNTSSPRPRIAYFRVSTRDQSIESQRTALGGTFDKEFIDHCTSGATLAASRPGFSELLKYAREGDTLYVYAVDRIGRDAIDVQTTVRGLLKRGISIHIYGLGVIAEGSGELIVAVLAQMAAVELRLVGERTAAGRATAVACLARTGLTHRGKASMGRPFSGKPTDVVAWRKVNHASISATASQFALSTSTVKRYCAA